MSSTDFAEIDCSSAGEEPPIPAIPRSMTYLGTLISLVARGRRSTAMATGCGAVV